MCRLTLSDLPPAPQGKTGWPWTKAGPQVPAAMPSGKPWPKISIVTPSYNQGRFIEETIRSILLQSYPNLEYIIVDGGSTDNSVEIIKKYEPWLTHWVSEPDRGQSHAINKGFDRATGEIFAWINSDDYYYPGVFAVIARAFGESPSVALVHGREHHIDINGKLIGEVFPVFRNARTATFYFWHGLLQLATFWRGEAYRAIGGLDETLHYQMDYDFQLRLSYRYRSMYVPLCIGVFRKYPEQKGSRRDERETIILEHKTSIERFLAQEAFSAWKCQLLRCWYRGALLWRHERALGFARALRQRLHQALTWMKGKQRQTIG